MNFTHSIQKLSWTSFLAFVLVAICLMPIFETGLYSDDIANFESRNGSYRFTSLSFTEIAKNEISEWKQKGRFNPGAILLQEFLFKSFKSIAAYKASLFVLNLLAVICFLFLLSVLSNQLVVLFFLLFYAGGIQMRVGYNDAYTSFTGIYQILSIFIFLCLSFFTLYIQRKSFAFFICSLVLFAGATLISEIGLSLLIFLLAVCIHCRVTLKKIFLIVSPYLLLALVYLTYILQLRQHATASYAGTVSNFELTSMLNVLFIQLFAAIPFSNLTGHYGLFLLLIEQLNTWYNIVSIATISIIFCACFYKVLTLKYIEPSRNSLSLLLLGFSLFIMPAIFIMPALKYQMELGWGNGYLPVYIQNFGISLILAIITYSLYISEKSFSKAFYLIFICVACISTITAFLVNSDSIRLKNYNTSFPPEALYQDIQAGLLSDCPDGSAIILDNDFFWNSTSFYSDLSRNFTGKHFNFILRKDWHPNAADITHTCFVLNCQKGDTLYCSLYNVNCNTGDTISLIKRYSNYHNIRLSETDKHVMNIVKGE